MDNVVDIGFVVIENGKSYTIWPGLPVKLCRRSQYCGRNLSIIIFIFLNGFQLNSILFCGVATLAAIVTTIFLILHMLGTTRRSKLPWHWIECVSILIVAILMAIFSSIIISIFTKGFIIIGVIGYVSSTVYFFDTFQKYQIAVTPIPRYAWTTPNMPDLS